MLLIAAFSEWAVWDWDWVAIATLLLAGATFALAWQNRAIVRSSHAQLDAAREDLTLAREQNETAQRSLESQTAPLLTSVPWGLSTRHTRFDPETGVGSHYKDSSGIDVFQATATSPRGQEPRVTIRVPFRNVGNGAAMITSVQVMIGGRVFDATTGAPIVPPGEINYAHLDVGQDSSAFSYGISLEQEGVDFAVIVGYSDVAGNERGAISLDIHRVGPQGDFWRARQWHLGESPEDALGRPQLSSLPL